MKTTYCALLAVAALALVKADTTTLSPIDTVFKHLSESLDLSCKKFNELSGYQIDFNKEKFVGELKNFNSKFQEKYAELIKNLEKEGKPYTEDTKKAIENLVKQFNETVKGLNTPETQAKVQKLQETFHASLKKLAEQVNEVGKSVGVVVPANIQKSVNEIFDEISKVNHKIQEKANQILAEAQAELKKKKASA